MLFAFCVRYHLLACDYDGTIASDGRVYPETVAGLRKAAESGRKLVLVTGRELGELLQVFPEIDLFDWVVAENGGLLYRPASREEFALAPEPPEALVALLRERGVVPLSIGRTIVATWEPHETTVLGAIRELGLELQVIFNKGAVMVLPSSVNKRSGLEAVLERLGLSAHNCVGVGDAENDHAFLSLCEFSVAVSNALPAVKESADFVTTVDHGAGVLELIDRLLADDLASLDTRPERRHVTLGAFDDGAEMSIAAIGPVVLVAGSSGSGKSTAAIALLERLAARDYQVCIIDPEGDHEELASAVVLGSAEHPPDVEQLLKTLAQPRTHAVVNLLAINIADRPQFFLNLWTRLQQMRAATGRPHWIAIDEAHHVLDSAFEPMQLALPAELSSTVLITVHPERLHTALLSHVDFAIGVGPEAGATLGAFAGALGEAAPTVESLPEQPGQVLLWQRDTGEARKVTLAAGRATQRRHRRKYAQGELGPDKSFYFRGADSKLNLRAQNLVVFNDIGAGVDDETWLYHLANGDYSAWIRDAIKDDGLAQSVGEVEREIELSPQDSRQKIRRLIEDVYTAPA
ncbi:MAG TPA: HAD-IIB family hydrolase [Polyangiaceae bacterium]|nr:HAD-IIB family hydrolase [Polyangiaceae bacterium]